MLPVIPRNCLKGLVCLGRANTSGCHIIFVHLVMLCIWLVKSVSVYQLFTLLTTSFCMETSKLFFIRLTPSFPGTGIKTILEIGSVH
uniref:Uncharacterized protein n=1 Tax=Rhizophora mucronata TaxID=61149 RepID=A0A2P2JKK1_RHIMU